MHTRMQRVRTAGLALAYILLVGGCGGDNGSAVSDGDKESPVDVVSADKTPTGTEAPSQATSPPPPDVAKDDVGEDTGQTDRQEQLTAGQAKTKRVPASYLEAVSAIDLRDFPRPDDAVNVEASALRLYYVTGATSDAAAEFGRSNLSAAGWKHNPEPDKSYGDDHFLWFEKQGFVCNLTALSGEETRVTIENCGNIDARELPRMADAAFKFEGPASVFYATVPYDG
jgi:hypothetical protein